MKSFTEGEMKHTVKKCCVCREIRPLFHITPPSPKFAEQNTKPLKMSNKWDFNATKEMCKRCEKNISQIKRSGRLMVPRFSGKFSLIGDTISGFIGNNTSEQENHFKLQKNGKMA